MLLRGPGDVGIKLGLGTCKASTSTTFMISPLVDFLFYSYFVFKTMTVTSEVIGLHKLVVQSQMDEILFHWRTWIQLFLLFY